MTILLLPILLTLIGQTPQPSPTDPRQWVPPRGWVESSGPPTADQWRCAALRPHLKLEMKQGLLQILEQPRVDLSGVGPPNEPATPAGEMGVRSSLRIGTSWLIAMYRGEHGGSLWLIDGSGKERRLGEEPGRALFHLKDRVALLVGPTDRGKDTGAILLFDPADLTRVPLRIETQGLPIAGVRTPLGGLTFATRTGVFRLQAGTRIERVVRLREDMNFPSSIWDGGSTIGLAFSHFVLMITDGVQRWLVPEHCPVLVEGDSSCECR